MGGGGQSGQAEGPLEDPGDTIQYPRDRQQIDFTSTCGLQIQSPYCLHPTSPGPRPDLTSSVPGASSLLPFPQSQILPSLFRPPWSLLPAGHRSRSFLQAICPSAPIGCPGGHHNPSYPSHHWGPQLHTPPPGWCTLPSPGQRPSTHTQWRCVFLLPEAALPPLSSRVSLSPLPGITRHFLSLAFRAFPQPNLPSYFLVQGLQLSSLVTSRKPLFSWLLVLRNLTHTCVNPTST